ncbi:MAG: glycosyl hydrolase [Pseudoclavibacter sp.]
MSRNNKRGRASLVAALTASLAFTSVAFAAPSVAAPTQPAVDGNSLAVTFAEPVQDDRPRVRLWTPGAAITEEGLRSTIESLDAQGFGGVEIVAFAAPDAAGDEWGWGTERWNQLVSVALDEASARDMAIDLTNGPRWPIAMPGIESADDPAASYELTFGHADVAAGTTYSGLLPERGQIREEGSPQLVAALAYPVATDGALDVTRAQDLTATVTGPESPSTASLEWAAPADGEAWKVFAFWGQPTAQKVDNKYVIDHFSQAGADASIDYWENTELADLGDKAGLLNGIFSDSLEYDAASEWTREFVEEFQELHGYDVTPYLPFVGIDTTYPTNTIPGFETVDPAVGEKVNHDYTETITHLFKENHLQPVLAMAERNGLDLRYQVGYNKPINMGDAALDVTIPETEAFGRNNLDNMRVMSAAAHIGDKSHFSAELAAEGGNNYGQTLEDILWFNKRAWAAGVNIQTLHGASYSGEYDGPGNVNGQHPTAKWPGFEGFGFVSNNWNRSITDESLNAATDYMARNNTILSKRAIVDIAIYHDRLDAFNDPNQPKGDGEVYYPDGGVLNSYGFNYDFVTPKMLDLVSVDPATGTLAAEGPGYQAVVVHEQQVMDAKTVDRLGELAKAGLPIVFAGKVPAAAASLNGGSDADVQAKLATLLALGNVTQAAGYEDVPSALAAAGVVAAAAPSSAVDILSQHRTDDNGDYYYLYNYNKVSSADALSFSGGPSAYPNIDKQAAFSEKSATFTLAGEGRPYLFNTWTGEIEPIADYTSVHGGVEVPLHFEGDEAKIVGLLTDENAAEAGIQVPTRGISGVTGASATYVDGELRLKTVTPGQITATLAEGGPFSAVVDQVQAPVAVADWSLSVEAIGQPENGSILWKDRAIASLGPIALGAELKPWKSIEGLPDSTSGVGTYTGTFTLDAGWQEDGSAVLELGDVTDAFSVKVNGQDLGTIDQLDTDVDLGKHAVAGTNTIEVTVTSVPYNAVNGNDRDSYGLLGTAGNVQVAPYASIEIPAVEPTSAPTGTPGPTETPTPIATSTTEPTGVPTPADPGAPAPADGDQNGSESPDADGDLATTGIESMAPGIALAALALIGLGLLLVRKLRRTEN